jgi:hypothetical protein
MEIVRIRDLVVPRRSVAALGAPNTADFFRTDIYVAVDACLKGAEL